MSTTKRLPPAPIIYNDELKAAIKKLIGGSVEGYYKSVSRHADTLPTECLVELSRTYVALAEIVKANQEQYRYTPTGYVMYKLMKGMYLPMLELYCKCEVLETPKEDFWIRQRFATERDRFIKSNKLRTARFYRNLESNGQTEEEYYKDFAIRTLTVQRSIIAQVIESHPTVSEEMDARQYYSDLTYPERVSKEIVMNDYVFAELY